jgi:hypothetical protein
MAQALLNAGVGHGMPCHSVICLPQVGRRPTLGVASIAFELFMMKL